MTNSINVKFLPKINLAKIESADSVTRILQSQSTNFLITPCKKALTFASHAGNRGFIPQALGNSCGCHLSSEMTVTIQLTRVTVGLAR